MQNQTIDQLATPAPRNKGFRWAAGLTRELAVSQFKLKYNGSVLGYLWSFIKPLMIFVVLLVIFVNFLHVGYGLPNFPMQLLLGIVLWNFFVETTSVSLQALVSNAHLLKKASFPRQILVISTAMTSLMTLCINVIVVMIIAAKLNELDLGLHSFAMIPLIIELYIFSLGVGFFLAILYVFYRDVAHLWEVSTQALFYGSGIIYSIVAISQKWARIFVLNPITQIVEDARHALIVGDTRVPWTFNIIGKVPFALQITAVLIFATIGWLLFNHLASRAAEYI